MFLKCGLFVVVGDGDGEQSAPRASRSSSETSSRRDSIDSFVSCSEFDDSGMGDNSVVSAGDTSLSAVDGQSLSDELEEQAAGEMSPFAVPSAAVTKDPIRLKCRQMLSAALKTPRECFVNDNYVS